MALQSSGTITLAQIASEFGDSQPHSLSEFYAGGSAGVTSGGAPNVPSSGTISMSQFYSAANQITVTISSGATNQNVSTLFGSNFTSSVPKILVINSGVEVGATSLSNYALQVPSGMSGTLNIQNAGTISGAGGDGGAQNGGNATDGGTALYIASSNVTVTNTGTIRGGGGGGGGGAVGQQGGTINPVGSIYCFSGAPGTGGAGGNGQGYDQSQSNGASGTAASPGTNNAGGNSGFGAMFCGGYNGSTGGSTGGNGGTYGNAGSAGGSQGGNSGGSAGSAGKYIQLSGVSYTLSNSGTLQGNAP